MGYLQDRAGEYLAQFEKRTRDSGESYWCRKEGAPGELEDLCHHAHGDMWPDDWRYEFIVEALSALSVNYWDEVEVEADVYTSQLTGWLHSRCDRCAYVDDAVDELGGWDSLVGANSNPLIAALSWGQWWEKREVLNLVRGWLEENCEEDVRDGE